MTAAIRVLVVDDHTAVRHGLLGMLGDEPGIETVGGVASATEAHERWLDREQPRPDVVLVDQHLSDEDGLSLCLWLKTAPRAPRVILYTADASEELALAAVVAGADAMASKLADPGELGRIICAVAAGERRLPDVSPRVAATIGARLSTADLPILGMLRHGVPPAELADTLCIDEAQLTIRRWAMLELLTAAPGRRRLRPAAEPPQPMRMAAPRAGARRWS